MNYKVTLAMLVYNVEKYVERALRSALDQTFSDIEYLVIYDKSNDCSLNLVKTLIDSHPRGKNVRIIHGLNLGPGAARDIAIKEAKGEFLYFIDSDDEIISDCIQRLYDRMLKEPVDFVAASFDRISTDGSVIDYVKPYKDSIFRSEGNERLTDLVYKGRMPHMPVMMWNKLYRTDFLRENQIFCITPRFGEDVLFTFQLMLKASSCALMSDITYHYYVTPNALTDKKSRTEERSKIFSQQYIEILEYKKRMLQDYTDRSWFFRAIRALIIESYSGIYEVINSRIKDKKKYIKQMLRFPIGNGDMKRCKDYKLFVLWVVSHSPYILQRFFLSCFYKRNM